ncbi:MAG: hypothetical protein ACI91Z_001653, partial [Yoonia sp.]
MIIFTCVPLRGSDAGLHLRGLLDGQTTAMLQV